MENFNPFSDQQRLDVLNTIYKKGLSTSQEDLAFSSDKLIYLKPFISKLQNDVCQSAPSLTNLVMVRQVIDELLFDIKEEIDATCSRIGKKRGKKLAFEYGLHMLSEQLNENFYYSKKVA
ncbi:MAG: hypothetical protein JKX84_06050 [Flavobacteriales bacterium]|nr:hypothetical protein [Flavobacteriales bacterium]